MHGGEAPVYTIVAYRKFFVVDTQLMENGRVYIVDRRFSIGIKRSESPNVALSIGSWLNSASAQPVREYKGIVIPSRAALRARHAAELRRPQNYSFVQ